MKKMLALFAIAFALLLGCTSTGPAPGGNNSQNSTVQTVQNGTAQITMENFAFNPATITVAKGTTVRWTNKDAAPHTITADDPSNFASGDIGQNGIFEHTFNDAGTYAYHCSIHASMRGTVIVQ